MFFIIFKAFAEYILKNIRWRSEIIGAERIETPEILSPFSEKF